METYNFLSFSDNYFTEDKKKPKKDKLNYSTKQLANGLNIMYIEDKNTHNCGAVLNIGVGTDNDPGEYMGLAHFIEHILFMGSKKYPHDNYFSKKLVNNGGKYNAFTGNSRTCFHFYSPLSEYLEMLDIFANFFIEPLFDSSAITREINAIESEHAKNINQQNWIFAHMCKLMFVDGHPGKKFSTGTKSSLRFDENNVDELKMTMKKFFSKYYVPSQMCLYIIVKNLTGKLSNTIEQLFMGIAGDKYVQIEYPNMLFRHSTNSRAFEKIEFSSGNDNIYMYFCWDIMWLRKYNITYDFLIFCISDTDTNSIYQKLLDLNLINNIEAGYSMLYGTRRYLFIKMELTENGSTEQKKIVSLMMSFFEMIKNNEQWLEEKYKNFIINRHLKYVDFINVDGISRALEFSEYSSNYDTKAEKLPVIEMQDFAFEEVSKDLKINISKFLSIGNLKLFYSHKLVGNLADMHILNYDEYYEVHYQTMEIDTSLDKIDISFPKNQNKYQITEIHIPTNNTTQKNLYSHLRVGSLDKSTGIGFSENINRNIYVDTSNYFNSIKSNFSFAVELPLLHNIKNCIKDFLYLVVYVKSLEYQHKDFYNEIKKSSYNLSCNIQNSGTIVIEFSGLPNYFTELFDIFLNKLASFELSEKNFIKSKGIFRLKLKNFIYKQTHKRIPELFNACYAMKYFSMEEMSKIIDDLEYRDIKYLKEYFTQTIKHGLFFGNIEADTCKIISDKIENIFGNFNGINIKLLKTDMVEDVKATYKYFVQKEKYSRYVCQDINKENKNSAIHFCIKIDDIIEGVTYDWDKKVCMSLMLNNYMTHEYFKYMRTDEQMGYIVGSMIAPINNDFVNQNLYLVLYAQSSNFSVEKLEENSLIFLTKMVNEIAIMPDVVFYNLRNGLYTMMIEEPKNILEKSVMDFSNILKTKTFPIFDRNSVLADTAKGISKQMFVNFSFKTLKLDRHCYLIGINSIKAL